MEKKNMKKKNMAQNIQWMRLGVQTLGLILTAVGIFMNVPIATTVLIGITFLMGPVFCGWVCPYGFLQDLAAKAGRVLGIKRRRMPKAIQQVLIYSRYLLFLLVLFISADFIFSLMSLDPRANLSNLINGNALTAIGWTIMGVFLLISVFFDRPFCNYLCVEGAKYGLYGIFRPITVTRDESTCVGCGKCDKACPMNIQVSSHSQVRSLQCINCMECVSSCPVADTLKISPVPLRKKVQKVMMPFMLMAALSCFAYIVYNDNDLNVPTIEVSAAQIAQEDEAAGTQASDAVDDTDAATDSETAVSEDSETTTEVIEGTEASSYGDAAGIADGTYEGTGTGFRGEMTVAVTVEGETITAIEVTQTTDDAKWLNRALNVVDEIISTQTTDVDSVSGATYSSMGIKEAVADALTGAGGTNVDTIVNNLPTGGGRRH